MSGEHFDQMEHRILEVAQRLREDIEHIELKREGHYEFSPKTLAEFKEGERLLRVAYVYAHRIAYLLSCDDGEDDFHDRLAQDLIGLEKKPAHRHPVKTGEVLRHRIAVAARAVKWPGEPCETLPAKIRGEVLKRIKPIVSATVDCAAEIDDVVTESIEEALTEEWWGRARYHYKHGAEWDAHDMEEFNEDLASSIAHRLARFVDLGEDEGG